MILYEARCGELGLRARVEEEAEMESDDTSLHSPAQTMWHTAPAHKWEKVVHMKKKKR